MLRASLLLAVVATATSQEPEIQLLASLPVAGDAYDMAKEGSFTYLLKNTNRLHIHDVTEKTNPVEVGTLNVEGKSLLTDGNSRLYIALPTMLRSYDLADPTAPVLMNTYNYPTGCMKSRGGRFMEQSPEHIYLTCHEGGSLPATWFIVIKKDTLTEMGHLVIPGLDTHMSSVWHGGRVYAIMSSSSIVVIDVSDPMHPVLVFSFPPFDIGSVAVFQTIFWEGHIYAVTDSHMGTLMKFDAATGERKMLNLPAPLQESDMTRCASIKTYNAKLYLACQDKGLIAVSEPFPNTIKLLGQDSSSFLTVLFEHGGYIFASGDSSNGLNIYDVPESVPELQTLSAVRVPGDTYDMAKAGGCVYLLKNTNKIHILDFTNKASPTEVGIMDVEGKSVLTHEGKLYVALADKLRVYDLTDPASPVLMNTYNYPARCTKTRGGRFMAQSPEHIYLTCHEDGGNPMTWFIVIEKGSALTEMGHLKIPGMDTHMSSVWDSGKVYAAMSSSRIVVIDVFDATRPALSFTFPSFDIGTVSVFQMMYWQGFIYAVTDSYKGTIMKFNSFTGVRLTVYLPYPLREMDVTRCTSIETYNTKLYLACQQQGLIVLRKSMGDTFMVLGHDASHFLSVLIADSGNIFSGGDSVSGLVIYDVPKTLPEVRLLASSQVVGDAYDMAKEGSFTYLLKNTNRLHIHDVTEKTNPVEVGTLNVEGKSLLTDGNSRLYIALPTMLRSYDLADPTAPVLMNTYNYPTGCMKSRGGRFMEQSPEHIYLTCHEGGSLPATWFIVIKKDTLTEMGHLVIPGLDTHMSSVWHGGRVYAIMSSSSIVVIDVSDPMHPVLVFSFPPFDIGVFTVSQAIYWEGHIYAVTDSHMGNLVKFNAFNGMLLNLVLPAPLRESDQSHCSSIKVYNSKLYLGCEAQGLIVLGEPMPNKFVVIEQSSLLILILIVDTGNVFASGNTATGFLVYEVPSTPPPLDMRNKGIVELVNGPAPVVKDVQGMQGEGPQGVWVWDETSGQQWVRIPKWLEGSTVHMGAFGKEGMALRLSCPSTEGRADRNYPCTFYVTIYNCFPCSSVTNGGLPKLLLDAGFTPAGCGPRYAPVYAGAPIDVPHHPAVIFKLQIEAGSTPIVIPVVKRLFHFAVFVHSAGQQCSLKDNVMCAKTFCDFDETEGCVDKPMCPKRSGPAQPGYGLKCGCFHTPNW